MHAVHRCGGLLLQMSHVAWSVCLSVCLCVGHAGVLCKYGWTDRDVLSFPFTALDRTNPFHLHPRGVTSRQCGFSRSQAITYIVNVAVCQKRCKTGSLLLYTTNRKWHVAYRISEIANSDDLEWPSRSFTYYKPFRCYFFIQLCNSSRGFNWHSTWHDPSVIAELLSNGR